MSLTVGIMMIGPGLLGEGVVERGGVGRGEITGLVTSMIMIMIGITAGRTREIAVDMGMVKGRARRRGSPVRMRMRRCQSIRRQGRSRVKSGRSSGDG